MIDIGTTTKYSVLIPTRNRKEYLPYAIDSVLSQRRDDIELIISNNHSSDGTSDYLDNLSDSRLKIVMPSRIMSMSGHYEFILNQASGDWVTILGDDDAVMPYFFERLDSIIDRYPRSSIIKSQRAYYFWEGCEDLYGECVFSYRTGKKIKSCSTKRELLWGLAGLKSCFELPHIYTSCVVKKSLVTEIKDKSGGVFYHSIIPDVYSAVALSLLENSYLWVEEPLFWTGTSIKSMSRSDHIYRDSELQSNSLINYDDSDRGIKLHFDISQEIHSARFESFYLYEALRQCPFASTKWTGKIVKLIVYASLRLQSGKKGFFRDITSKIKLNKTISLEIKRNGFSEISVIFVLIMLRIIDAMHKIVLLPNRVKQKIVRLKHKNTIGSNVRRDYPNIKEASNAVLMLIGK